MVSVALFVQLEAKPGKEDEVAAFLRGALPLVDAEPATTAWFAIQMGPSTFGIFDAFPDDEGRDAHLGGKVAAALMEKAPDLLALRADHREARRAGGQAARVGHARVIYPRGVMYGPTTERIELPIDGMSCAACASKIERTLNSLEGVEATVNYATEQATVRFDPVTVAPGDLVGAVEAAGYHARMPAADPAGALRTRVLSPQCSRCRCCWSR